MDTEVSLKFSEALTPVLHFHLRSTNLSLGLTYPLGTACACFASKKTSTVWHARFNLCFKDALHIFKTFG